MTDVSPAEAEWPLINITDGAVGCLLLTDGRCAFPSACVDDILLERDEVTTGASMYHKAKANAMSLMSVDGDALVCDTPEVEVV